jgi:hypothetical protein
MVKDVKSHANARKLHDEVDEEFTDIKTAKEVAGFVAPVRKRRTFSVDVILHLKLNYFLFLAI